MTLKVGDFVEVLDMNDINYKYGKITSIEPTGKQSSVRYRVYFIEEVYFTFFSSELRILSKDEALTLEVLQL